MSTDKALAKLAAARLRLFNASQHREAVVLRRVRVDNAEAFKSLNAEIADARADVIAAAAELQDAIDKEPPTDPGPPGPPPDPVQAARDTALDAVLTARDALTAVRK